MRAREVLRAYSSFLSKVAIVSADPGEPLSVLPHGIVDQVCADITAAVAPR
jgi:hypothetical protein